MKVVFDSFDGIAPALDPRVVKESVAMVAHNVDITSTKLVPCRANKSGVTPPADEDRQGSWRWGDVDYVASPLNEDKYKRVYYTKDGMLYHKGTFGERRIYSEKPNIPVSATIKRAIDYMQGSFEFYAGWIPDGEKRKGTITGVSIDEESGKAKVTASVDGYYITGDYGSMEIVYPKEYGWLTMDTGKGLSTRTFNYSSGTSIPAEYIIKDDTDSDYARAVITDARIVQIIDPKNGAEVVNGGVYYGGVIEITIEIEYANPLNARYYAYTIVDDIGQESPTSDISDQIFVRVGDNINLNIQNVPKTANGIRIYRTGGSITDKSASFYFVDEIELDLIDQTISLGADETYADKKNRIVYTKNSAGYLVATFTDKKISVVITDENLVVDYTDFVDDSALAEEHLDVQNPPEGIYGLDCIHGSLVAANGQNVYFSEPYMAFDWNVAYNHTTASKIVGLAVSGQSVFCLTEGFPEILSGIHPATMAQIKSTHRQACASKKSIVSCEGLVCYASPDGLVAIDESGACTVLTAQIITRDQWQTLDPTTMVCAVHDKNILIFTKNHGTIVYDMQKKSYTTDDTVATDVYSDIKTDTLYLNSNRTWRTAEGFKRSKWRSKILSSNRPFAFSAARVILSPPVGNNGVLRLYSLSRDSVTTPTADFTNFNSLPCHSKLAVEIALPENERSFRLPIMRKELEWVAELETESKVISIELATSKGEL